jgi:AcrR family transcriptional regulator
MVSPMPGVRAPRQKRAQASWAKLLDAAEELLADAGYDGFTVAALSRRSGMSNGGIFWRVESMDALFVAIHERLIGRLRSEQTAALAAADRRSGEALEPFVQETVRALAVLFKRHGRLLRPMVLRAGSDAAAAERGSAAVRESHAQFVAHMAPRLAAAGCRDPDIVGASIFRISFGALVARITWPDHQQLPHIPWERFVDDLAEMAAGYATRHVEASRTDGSR